MYEQLKLENQVCFRLYAASRLITQAYHSLLEPLGLTYPQYLVMMVLWENDNLTVNKIGATLLLESNTLTPLLQRMEQDGLVVRNRGLVDARQTMVSLTKKGRQLQHKAKDIPTCLMQCWQGEPMEEKQLANFIATLDGMIDTLKKQ
jgi:DNA-binding MarR family transcriptional regulator